MIEARGLTKRYEDGLLALNQLNFSVQKGEIFCLLGANGAGKTTTINLFLNFIEPTEGTPVINGIDVTRAPLDAKKNVAYVSENVMLYGNFTARQNLEFFTRLGGKRLSRSQLGDIMRRVGLQEKAIEQRVKSFSKGMRQKLGIAIAITKDAPAVLLDEPTSGLDPKAGNEFMKLIKDLRDEGKAILMSTHDIFRARELGDSIGIMKDGQLVMKKSREELQHEDLERIYLDYMQN